MTLLRKCLLELRARHEDWQMNELNGYDIEDLRAGMHATVSKTDGSLETVKLRLPTVITTELRPNEPRYVTLQKECLTPTS